MSKRPNIRTMQMQDTIDRQKRRIFELEAACKAFLDRNVSMAKAQQLATLALGKAEAK